jgi:hypothetical protein
MHFSFADNTIGTVWEHPPVAGEAKPHVSRVPMAISTLPKDVGDALEVLRDYVASRIGGEVKKLTDAGVDAAGITALHHRRHDLTRDIESKVAQLTDVEAAASEAKADADNAAAVAAAARKDAAAEIAERDAHLDALAKAKAVETTTIEDGAEEASQEEVS